jgi:hypothetical protein
MGRFRAWFAVPSVLLLFLATAGMAADMQDALKAFREGNYSTAEAALRVVVEQEPDNLGARYWLGRSLFEQGKLQAAEAELRQIVEAKPDSEESRLWLGITLARQGRNAEARTQLEKVLTDNPNHKEAREWLAQLGPAQTTGPTPPPTTAPTAAPKGNTPSGGHRVAVSVDGLSLDVGQVGVLSSNVYDYTFTTAPTDWIPRAGTWKQTNRWDCSPQWTWYGGYNEDGLAATWNKHEFLGDVTVEIYAAMKMGVGADRRYKNPNDMNLSIHTDGANLDSGYSFIMGGELNTYSRIMKGDTVLAETRDEKTALFPIFEDAYPKDAYDFHRKWWALRARLSGNKLQFYKDEQLILEATDPDPLPGGRVALWTMHNGIIVSRAKIYYANEKVPPDPIPVDALRRMPPIQSIEPRAIEVASETHPAIYDDFETDVGEWRSGAGSNGARLSLVAPGSDGKGHALAMTDDTSGGQFEARLNTPRLDARKYGHLSFDYRVDPDVRLNLQCVVNSGVYEIVFTAPDGIGPQAQILARIPDVKADGQWHTANVDLIGYLDRLYKSDEPIWLEEFYFANTHTDAYIHAGFGGNHAGATLAIDNFYLGGAGTKDVTLSWSKRGDAEVQDCTYTIDQQPYTVPSGGKLVGGADIADSVTGSGTYYAHIRPKLADGSWGATVNRRLVVDSEPPKVTLKDPDNGQTSGAAVVSIGLTDPGGSGIDPNSITLRAQGKDYTCDGAALRYDLSQDRLIFDLGAAGLGLKDGDSVVMALASASDRLGHGLGQPVEWRWKYDARRDKTPPTTPYIRTADDYLCRDDFESDLSQWSTFGGPDGAVVCRDPSTAAAGDYSLRLFNYRQGGRFGVYVRKDAFDAGKYRLMTFDYNCSGRLRADFGLYVNGRWRSVRFTDTDNTRSEIGQIPDVRTDGQWHHAEVNLFDLLRQADPQTSSYMVRYLILADWGWMGNAQGRTYHIDNFDLIPVTSAVNGLQVSWRTTDASGIAGASYALDRSPDTDPGKKKMTDGTAVTLHPDLDGECYVHVRSVDGAGNWSEPGHLRLIIDRDRPVVALASPQPDQRAAASKIVFSVADKGPAGINPASLKLKVDGQEYDTASGYLSYDATAGKLTWDGAASSTRSVAFEDGQTVSVELTGAADFVGNQAPLAPAFTWTMDYSKDNEPPLVTQVKSTSHLTLVADTFEEGLDAWQSRTDEGGGTLSLDQDDPGGGQQCLKITNEKAGGAMAVTAWDEDFSVDRYPILSFDYKLDPGVRLDLMVFMDDAWQAIGFTDKDGQLIETIPGAVADGKWHHATLDLAAALRKQKRNGPLEVQQVVFSDRGNMDNAVGAAARFDNFMIARIGKSAPSFRWKAADATGITDYSYVLDQSPSTTPDEVGEGTGTTTTLRGTDGGLWYFHVRAKDGAGHWGPAAHYAILHLAAPQNG